MTPFRLVGLAAEPFDRFFAMSAGDLAAVGACRVVADAPGSYPCRVSLVDAEVGAELLLLSFEHLGQVSPYRASGPIFVRAGASRAVLEPGLIPPYVSRRLMSVRAYDVHHRMVAGEVCEGTGVREPIGRLLADDAVAYVHLHNARRGCFSCRVERVD